MNDATPDEAPRGQGGFLITKIHHLSRRALGRRLKAAGIDDFNPGQGRILFALWQGDGITITDLAKRTSLEKSTLTRMLDRLEADGMVRREFPPEDRRTVRVVLTAKTREMLGAFATVSEEMGRLLYRGFTEGEIQAFERMLGRILVNLSAEEEA